jgi:hypothetical protein
MGVIMKTKRIPDFLKTFALTLALACALQAQPLPGYELSVGNPVLAERPTASSVPLRVGPTNFRIGSQFIMTFNTGAFTAPAAGRASRASRSGADFSLTRSSRGTRSVSPRRQSFVLLRGRYRTTGSARISTFEITGVSVLRFPSLGWVNLPRWSARE